MVDERRRGPRARIRGARIRYESAFGERMSARVLDLGSGGLFIETDNPLPVKKRLTLEIHVTGELAPWAALGRVVWVRAARDADQRPPGMGVAFIDVDDAVQAAIRRVLARHPVADGAGGAEIAPAAPAREKTVLGVGPSAAAAIPAGVTAAPIVAAAPAREKTVLGVGSGPASKPPPDPPPQRAGGLPAPQASPPAFLEKLPRDIEEEKAWELEDAPQAASPPPPVAPIKPEATAVAGSPVREQREQSVAIDLVSRRPSGAPAAAVPDREASLRPAGVPRRGRGARLLLLLLLASAAGAGFAFRDRLRPLIASYAQKAPWMAPAAPATPVAAPVPGPTPSPNARQADMPAAVTAAPSASDAGVASAANTSTRRAETTATPTPSAGRAAIASGAVPPAPSASAAKAPTHRQATPGPKPAPAAASPPATENPDNPY